MLKNQVQEPQAGLPSDISQQELLREVFGMVMKAGLKKDMKPMQWAKLLLALHNRGFLYIIPGNDKPIDIVVGGYRIPSTDEKYLREVPKEESGDIFYCPFYLPKDRKLPLGAARRFFRNSGIKSVVFEDDNDQLKEYKFKRRHHGRKEIS